MALRWENTPGYCKVACVPQSRVGGGSFLQKLTRSSRGKSSFNNSSSPGRIFSKHSSTQVRNSCLSSIPSWRQTDRVRRPKEEHPGVILPLFLLLSHPGTQGWNTFCKNKLLLSLEYPLQTPPQQLPSTPHLEHEHSQFLVVVPLFQSMLHLLRHGPRR